MSTKNLCKYYREKLLTPDEQRLEIHDTCYFSPAVIANFDTLEVYGVDYPQRTRSIESNIMYLFEKDFNAKNIDKMNKID